jgi:Thioesterase superfamily
VSGCDPSATDVRQKQDEGFHRPPRGFTLGESARLLVVRGAEGEGHPLRAPHDVPIADLAKGAACFGTLEAGESFTTLELEISFLRPIWTGGLTARAQAKKGGRTVALLE